MSHFWRHRSIWLVLPALAALTLALVARPVLWVTHVGSKARNPLGNTVGHEMLWLGLVFLVIHIGISVLRSWSDELPSWPSSFWYTSTVGEKAVAVALLEGIVILALYCVAISAWWFEVGGRAGAM